jgi:hypothetical protein
MIRLDHHGNAHKRSRGTMATCSAGSVGVEGRIQAFLERRLGLTMRVVDR